MAGSMEGAEQLPASNGAKRSILMGAPVQGTEVIPVRVIEPPTSVYSVTKKAPGTQP